MIKSKAKMITSFAPKIKEIKDKKISKNLIYCRTPAQNRDTRWSLQSKDRTIALISLSPQM